MNSALPATMMGALCLTALMSFSVSAQSATPPAPTTQEASTASTANSADSKATNIRTKHPFVARAPIYNSIPMEYRLAAIEGPRAERIIDDYIEYGFSDFGSLLLTKKDQLPAKLRTEPGTTCSTCEAERGIGRRNVEYYVAWLRGLNAKQRKQLIATLEK